MCGICGFSWEDKKLVQDMASVISHRGPDDSGHYTDKDISLGHQRLSVIDLSKNGRQPMSNENQDIWIAYNGEIYNFKELKKELESKGHKFNSDTDTEVIIHSYEEYGYDCLKYLNGMFAFAIWDSAKKILFLARDRIGIKPLYYSAYQDKIVFASEIKSLMQHSQLKKDIDHIALGHLLSLRFVPGPRTILKEINKLLPGYYLIFHKGKIQLKKYWDFTMNPVENSLNHYSKRLRQLIEKSVQMRLMSDVPLGAYLSGGIDSGSIIGLMNKFSDNVKTFTISFSSEEKQEKEEIYHANLLAEHFNTDHQNINIKADNTIELLPKIVWHADEPISDATLIPTYMLAWHTKPKVTVVLTGDGPDELFAGYEQFKIMWLGNRYAKHFPNLIRSKFLPLIAKNIPKRLLDILFEYSSSLGEKGIERFSDFLRDIKNRNQAYLDLVSVFNAEEKKELYNFNKDLVKKDDVELKNMLSLPNKGHFLNQMLLFEIKKELVDDFLMKDDKMTMAHSVEARVPFLDYNIVELSASIPARYKLHGMTDKYILRDCMKDLLPKDILKKKKKRFFVPIDTWVNKDLKGISQQILYSDTSKNFFSKDHIDKIFKNYNNSRLYYGRQIWSLMCFILWNKIYLENEKPVLDINKLI